MKSGTEFSKYYALYPIHSRPLLQDIKEKLKNLDSEVVQVDEGHDPSEYAVFRFSDGHYLQLVLKNDQVAALNANYNNSTHVGEVYDRVRSLWPQEENGLRFGASPQTYRDVELDSPWREPRYTIPDFFLKNPGIYRKKGIPSRSADALRKMLQPKMNPWQDILGHRIDFPSEMPAEFIPTGRIGDGLKRDEVFYRNAVVVMKKRYSEAKNILFVNYTGHEGPVAAALAKNKISSHWSLTASPRILDQIRDWVDEIARASQDALDSNVGLILEPNHGPTRIETWILPEVGEIQGRGIHKIVVFSEDRYSQSSPLPGSYRQLSKHWPDPEMEEFLNDANQLGIQIVVEGLESQR